MRGHPALGHSPSWMQTLTRRAAPPLALARNCRSSGVTTSARNMAGQVESSSRRGLQGAGVFKEGGEDGLRRSRTRNSTEPQQSVQIRMKYEESSFFDARLQSVSVCLDSKCDGMRRDTAQVTGTVSCGQRWNLITSLPNLAPSLTVQPGVLACKEPETQNCGDVNPKASQYLIE